ncbi:SMI1/KNR4 family protein [Kordia algicida OT-1]|uniref:Knr4/Smi1-like domain-containing protein n=1 Tax=Kordia algicida OT-1 TaxID=391587 RepID=A9DRK0_9FLAO|nr:SMI1/KNR4 family protein [Kordia algicida]EDP96805.1 hypothetical protein KAOT1_16618 [Kordia algicida OT-1]
MRLFKKSSTQVTEEDLQEFENTLGKRLPEDYRQFMKDYNGGIQIKEGNLWYPNYVSEEGELVLKKIHRLEIAISLTEIYDFLPKAVNIGGFFGGIIAMSLSDNDYGNIYIQFSYTDPEKVADSFTEFIEGLEDYD